MNMISNTKHYTIGAAAMKSGISAKMIRHYEQIGLLKEAARTEAGYRLYSDRDLHVLHFIRHSRDLGFSIKQMEELLGLWQESHLQALDEKIQELNIMKAELARLVDCCMGDSRPDCPILEGLAGG